MPYLNPSISIYNYSKTMAVILDQLQIEKLKTLPNFTLQHLDKVTELYQHLFYDPFASICGFKSI